MRKIVKVKSSNLSMASMSTLIHESKHGLTVVKEIGWGKEGGYFYEYEHIRDGYKYIESVQVDSPVPWDKLNRMLNKWIREL